MSVQTQINRISDAVSDAFSALATKGVSVPSGTKVDGLANLISSIKNGGNIVVKTITFASEIANTEKTILTGDAFAKEHYGCTGFSAVLIPVNCASITNSTNAYVPFVYSSNRGAIKTGSVIYYGFIFRGGSSSASLQGSTTKLSTTGWNVSLRAYATGNITLYVSSSFKVPAGSYYLILYCDE